ncbi:MAG: DUF4870 domain-containing protein [Salinirussus sp.]
MATETSANDGGGESGDVDYEVTSEDRTWGILAHASAFIGLVIPFGNILGPLLVWAIKKEESQFVRENGRQALNFQITWTIILIIAGLSILVAIGLLLVPILAIAWLILVIIAIIRASNNKVYDYPLTLDLIS